MAPGAIEAHSAGSPGIVSSGGGGGLGGPDRYRKDHLEHALQAVGLEDLVAVFSRAEDGSYLLVYNTLTPPSPPNRQGRVLSLHDLRDQDLSAFDGLRVAFPGVDIIRPDLLTKGPGFYPLERWFLQRGQGELLRQTMFRLAGVLAHDLEALSEGTGSLFYARGSRKILALVLPTLLAAGRAEDLMMAIAPTGLLAAAEGRNWQLVYNTPGGEDDLERVPIDQPGGILAFEEALAFVSPPGAGSRPVLELRPILRGAGFADVVERTLRRLAHRCAAREEPVFQSLAFSLAAEIWLGREDVTDLVVFQPHPDFAYFLETGTGTRLYRRLAEGAPGADSPAGNRGEWRFERAGDIEEGTPIGFSLFPSGTAGSGAASPELDLGRLLWKAGQGAQLARTLGLIAADGSSAGTGSALPPQLLNELAIRAVVLMGLDDPWPVLRYEQRLAGGYRALQETFELRGAADKVREAYYQGVSLWYGCYGLDEPGILAGLEAMIRVLKGFLRGAQAPAAESDSWTVECREQARNLIEIGEAIVHLTSSTGFLYPSEDLVGRERESLLLDSVTVREVFSKKSLQLATPSFLFGRLWQTLLARRRQRIQIQKSPERDVESSLRDLNGLLGVLQRDYRVLYALPHEISILQFAYRLEIRYIETLVGELERSAILEVTLRESQFDIEASPDLHFEVFNVGRVPAQEITLRLEQTDEFKLLEGAFRREVAELLPGDRTVVTYPIRPLVPEITLTLTYDYHDSYNQVREGRQPFHRNVRSLTPIPFQSKVNRYQFGSPIQKPEGFFGRREELLDLLSLLYAGGVQNVLLRGARRMGKTSLLYMLQRALTDYPTRRLFEVPEAWDAALDRFCPVFLSLQSVPVQNDVTYILQFFHSLLEQICRALRIEPEVETEILDQYAFRSNAVGAANAVQEQLRVIFQAFPERRVVVLLDEYDEVYQPYGQNMDDVLRAVVSAEQRLTWIIASTLALYKESKSTGSPWFNIFLIMELGLLSPAAAQNLVVVPSRDERVYWRPEAVSFLLQETGCHPAFLQLFCSKIITYLNHERTNFVLHETIAAIAEKVVEEQETAYSHFEFYWSDNNGVGKLILLIIDDSGVPLKRAKILPLVYEELTRNFGSRPCQLVTDAMGRPAEWRERQFKEGMEWVEKVTNAVSAVERRYHFTVPLFQRWLRGKRRTDDLFKEALDAIAAEMKRDSLD